MRTFCPIIVEFLIIFIFGNGYEVYIFGGHKKAFFFHYASGNKQRKERYNIKYKFKFN